jgi:holo-[acyl-carrier-protein] synthase
MIIGLGIDILEFSKLDHLVKTGGEQFTNTIFTQSEIHYAKTHHGLANLATAFTAKEAAIKALRLSSLPKISLLDIEVRRTEGGKPSLYFSGDLARKYPATKYRFHLSQSFTATLATSVVLLETIS